MNWKVFPEAFLFVTDKVVAPVKEIPSKRIHLDPLRLNNVPAVLLLIDTAVPAAGLKITEFPIAVAPEIAGMVIGKFSDG